MLNLASQNVWCWRPACASRLLGALGALMVMAGCGDDPTPGEPSAGSSESGCGATVVSASIVELPGGISLTRAGDTLTIRTADGNSIQSSWPPSAGSRIAISTLELNGPILTTPNGCTFDITELFD